MAALIPVILCGGSGTRLWPRSRKLRPKPFLPLIGPKTLFQSTLERCDRADMFMPPLVVLGADHLALAMEQTRGQFGQQLGKRKDVRFLVEPMARGTAAAVALAALNVPEDALMLVCPSDHHIANTAAFHHAVNQACSLAQQDWLVSLAITADRPETGFGYLQRGEALEDYGFRTRRFIEKPDLARAQQFLSSGDYAWNSGIFLFKARVYLEELQRYCPAMLRHVQDAMASGQHDGSSFTPDSQLFDKISGETVDYAVMELTDRAAMVPVQCGWSDIGTWSAMQDALSADDQGNHVHGAAELLDCRNVLVESDSLRVCAIGLEDVMIIVDGQDVLITTRAGAQKVGKLKAATQE